MHVGPRFVSLFLYALALSSPTTGGENPRNPLLASHNRLRAAVGIAPLRWSTILATTAQDWADHLAVENECRMQHSGPGENLFWASPITWRAGRREPQRITPETVVDSWAKEQRFYLYDTNQCLPGKVCGHYTQMVWRDTTTIGCAYRICANRAQLWVCHYRPAGNVIGRRPY